MESNNREENKKDIKIYKPKAHRINAIKNGSECFEFHKSDLIPARRTKNGFLNNIDLKTIANDFDANAMEEQFCADELEDIISNYQQKKQEYEVNSEKRIKRPLDPRWNLCDDLENLEKKTTSTTQNEQIPKLGDYNQIKSKFEK